jgi:hypothetical protein
MKRFFFLFFIVAVLFVGASGVTQAVTCPDMVNWSIVGGVCVPTTAGTGLSSSTVSKVLSTVLLWILGILSVIGVLAFVISGVQYLTAVGDEDQISTAKRNMKYAIIGLIVALSGYIIVTQISRIFAGNAGF